MAKRPGKKRKARQPIETETYAISKDGTELLRAAQREHGIPYREIVDQLLSRHKIESNTNKLSFVFNRLTDECTFLPELCEILGVPFWRTQRWPYPERTIIESWGELYELSQREAHAAVAGM